VSGAAATVVISGEGQTTATFFATDSAGNVEMTRTVTVKIDQTPPVTTATLAGTAGGGGWFISPVKVTLAGTDALSGVAYTSFSIDGGTAQTYAVPFTISADGTHTGSFSSTDVAGNAEPNKIVTFKIDQMPPVTTATLAGTAGGGGWFISPVKVTLPATDALSRVAYTSFSIDGGTAQSYATAFTISTDGTHTVGFSSTDVAGNVELSKTVKVTIDQTPPVTTATASPGALPPGALLVSVSATATVKSTTGATLGTTAVQCFDTLGLVDRLNAVDNTGGSGVASLTYAASGAQPINSTTVNGASTQPMITATGLTTLTYAALDVAGNREAIKNQSIVVGRGDDGFAYACAATPSFAVPLHGMLVVTGAVTANGKTFQFKKSITF